MNETGTLERKQVCFSTYIWPMSENRDGNRTFRMNLKIWGELTDRQTDRRAEPIAYTSLAHVQCGVKKVFSCMHTNS